MKYIVLIIALVCLVCVVKKTHADPIPGLWQQQVITVDDVKVRKVLDNTGGSYNVCYIASADSGSVRIGLNVSISCVAEKKLQ